MYGPPPSHTQKSAEEHDGAGMNTNPQDRTQKAVLIYG